MRAHASAWLKPHRCVREQNAIVVSIPWRTNTLFPISCDPVSKWVYLPTHKRWVNPTPLVFHAVLRTSQTSFFDMMWWCHFSMIFVTFCDHFVIILWCFLRFLWHNFVMSFCDVILMICMIILVSFLMLFDGMFVTCCSTLSKMWFSPDTTFYNEFWCMFMMLVSFSFHFCDIICIKCLIVF